MLWNLILTTVNIIIKIQKCHSRTTNINQALPTIKAITTVK